MRARSLFTLLVPALFACAEGGGEYDVVILNGRVMDPETSFDGVRNVGVKDGMIAIITEEAISGLDTIDATGQVVTAGFIDTHFHWVRPVGYKLGLRDGVTSGMDLEFGTLGSKIEQWYADRAGGTQMNYGTSSSHEAARALILDQQVGPSGDAGDGLISRSPGTNWADTKPTLEQGNEILRLLDQGLQQGAIGIGSTLGYMREGVTSREMFEVQRTAANYGRQTSVHLRFTPGTSTQETLGAQEVLANALALGAPACINHFNNPGWEMVQELLHSLQQRGFNVWGEIYPYAAGSTSLNAAFLRPEVWLDQLGHRYEETLMDPATNTFYTRETYEREIRGPNKVVIVYKMPESVIPQWLQLPGATMGGDGLMIPPGDQPWDTPYEDLGNTHPRTAGAHGASLRIAREQNIPLMQVLAMLSYNSAKHLGDMGLEGMKVRGRLQQGMVADITIFDPQTVRDNSTYERGALPTTGIPFVLVNGVVVVRDSEVLKDVNPGQPMRFPVEQAARFRPVSVEGWYRDNLVAPVDFGGTSEYAAPTQTPDTGR